MEIYVVTYVSTNPGLYTENSVFTVKDLAEHKLRECVETIIEDSRANRTVEAFIKEHSKTFENGTVAVSYSDWYEYYAELKTVIL